MSKAWETCYFPKIYSDFLSVCYVRVVSHCFRLYLSFQAEHFCVLCWSFEFCGKLAGLCSFPISL